MKEFEINELNQGQRFDKYLARIIGEGGMSFIYKMLRKKNFVLNDKKATGKEVLKSGDVVKLYISDDTFEKFKTKNSVSMKKTIDVRNDFNFLNSIIYEDNDIIIVNKPANILSQKAKKEDVSINEYLIDYLISNNKITSDDLVNYRPSFVNRLDRNTTGIIIAAKNLKAAQYLSEGLKERTINKYYKCIVAGDFDKSGKYTGFLSKNSDNNTVKISDKKNSEDDLYIETEYKKIDYKSSYNNDMNNDNGSKSNMDGISSVEVHLITGKSHQIRAHLSYLGFPIIGDTKYGLKKVNSKFKAKHQLLHAYKIIFPVYDDDLTFEFSGKTFISEPDFRY